MVEERIASDIPLSTCQQVRQHALFSLHVPSAKTSISGSVRKAREIEISLYGGKFDATVYARRDRLLHR